MVCVFDLRKHELIRRIRAYSEIPAGVMGVKFASVLNSFVVLTLRNELSVFLIDGKQTCALELACDGQIR